MGLISFPKAQCRYPVRKRLSKYMNRQERLAESRAVLVDPVTTSHIPQRGESCKLKALHEAMCFARSEDPDKVPPLYKDRGRYGEGLFSVREVAKRYAASAVGEIYTLDQLRRTAFFSGFVPKSYCPSTEDEYLFQLMRLLEQNQPVVVFYDCDLTPGERYGSPRIGDGGNEHAGFVVGYYLDPYDQPHFIVKIWDQYHDFDGMELALSAMNLLQQRKPERFVKVYDPEVRKNQWLLRSGVADVSTWPAKMLRTAPKPKAGKVSLRGQLVALVEEKNKDQLEFPSDYSAYLSEGSDTVSDVAVAAIRRGPVG